MNIVLIITLMLLWLGVILKWQMRREARRERLASFPGQRGEWITGPCPCGCPRRDWEALEVSREAFTLLLRCRQCGKFWEEKMEGKAFNKWREVDSLHVRAFYSFEPQEDT
ncbi:MAG: hypothetical protein ACOY4Q_03895 [Bacillota bacterium]